MKVVSRFEAHLLGLLHFILQRMPAAQAQPLLSNSEKPPAALSRPAVDLVKDALAKGCTLLLARVGGWRRERHLRGEHVVAGRLWERTPPAALGLTFSGESLAFLIWLTAVDPQKPRDCPWQPQITALTVGDLVLLFFAYVALREANVHTTLGLPRRAVFAQHGLCRLAFPGDFGAGPAEPGPNFTPWTQGTGSCVLEVLQPFLARQWLQVEHSKETITEFRVMRNLGRSQEQALQAHARAVETAGRLDLARFLLQAGAALLSPSATAWAWVGGLTPVAGQRLADRAVTIQAALALVRHLDRLKAWQRRACRTGFLDEGYAASQLWLADWERYGGDVLHARAQAIIRQVEPLHLHEAES